MTGVLVGRFPVGKKGRLSAEKRARPGIAKSHQSRPSGRDVLSSIGRPGCGNMERSVSQTGVTKSSEASTYLQSEDSRKRDCTQNVTSR